jgi:hypothetical protein
MNIYKLVFLSALIFLQPANGKEHKNAYKEFNVSTVRSKLPFKTDHHLDIAASRAKENRAKEVSSYQLSAIKTTRSVSWNSINFESLILHLSNSSTPLHGRDASSVRLPCNFFQGERFCDTKKASLCQHVARVAVLTVGWNPGGPEALWQLSIAIWDSIPSRAFVAFHRNESFHLGIKRDYADATHIPVTHLEDLCPGDILIVPEIMAKRLPKTPLHVKIFVWQLAIRPEPRGLNYIYHNHWLAQSGHDLPSERVITPYVSPHWIEAAKADAGLNELTGELSTATSPLLRFKEPLLVLIDNDTPNLVVKAVTRAANENGGDAVLVQHKSEAQLLDLYRRATVVFDWCLVGSERMPLEASLFGALFITSSTCGCGGDFSDFPISSRYVYSGDSVNHGDSTFESWINELFEEVYGVLFWNHVSKFAPMRLRTLTYGRRSMGEEAALFWKFETTRNEPVLGSSAAAFEVYFSRDI